MPGFEDAEPGPEAPLPHPLAALERAVLPALQRSPCLIAFSGGRDSSAVLALAVRLARREGLAPPVPVTRRHPGFVETDEDEWQELVIRHLSVSDWVKLTFDDGELDLVGPVAARSLRRHGLVWPPMHLSSLPLFDMARGGALVTGEGGDEIFGPRRIAPLTRLLGRMSLGRRPLGQFLRAAAPTPVRRVLLRSGDPELRLPWLRPHALSGFLGALARDEASEPLRWDASLLRLLRRRATRTGLGNLALLADESDTWHVHPLLDPGFVHALAAFGGWKGFPSRRLAMRALFGDLLPDRLLSRQGKAFFNSVALGPHSRAFSDQWDGSGVDTTLVDPAALRRAWTAPTPHAASFALLQQAWLTT